MPKDDDETPVDPRPTRGTPVEAADPVEEVAVTGRPNDEPGPNATFAERAKARQASEKRIAEAQNKAVQSADTKSVKKAAAKK